MVFETDKDILCCFKGVACVVVHMSAMMIVKGLYIASQLMKQNLVYTVIFLGGCCLYIFISKLELFRFLRDGNLLSNVREPPGDRKLRSSRKLRVSTSIENPTFRRDYPTLSWCCEHAVFVHTLHLEEAAII